MSITDGCIKFSLDPNRLFFYLEGEPMLIDLYQIASDIGKFYERFKRNLPDSRNISIESLADKEISIIKRDGEKVSFLELANTHKTIDIFIVNSTAEGKVFPNENDWKYCDTLVLQFCKALNITKDHFVKWPDDIVNLDLLKDTSWQPSYYQ